MTQDNMCTPHPSPNLSALSASVLRVTANIHYPPIHVPLIISVCISCSVIYFHMMLISVGKIVYAK